MFDTDTIAEVQRLSAAAGIPLDIALGTAKAESGGRAFWKVNGRNVPAIRPEGHYFYKFLSGDERQQAVLQGLASPKAQAIKVPGSFKGRYDMLSRMRAINDTAALQSISMGLGQVMGSHCKRLGYSSVQEMWARANSGVAGQIELMIRYFTSDPEIFDAAKARNYKTLARLYNGPNYKVNQYDTKIARYSKEFREDGFLSRVEDHNETIAQITSLGFATVKEFQKAYGLSADGIIGPITLEAVAGALAKQKEIVVEKPVIAATKVGTAAAGTAVVATWIEQGYDILGQLQPLFQTLKLINVGTHAVVGVSAAVMIGAIGFGTYKWYFGNKQIADA